MASFYRVFVVRFLFRVEDADPPQRYHTAVFVETEQDGSGYLHEVDGNTAAVQSTDYSCRFTERPEKAQVFLDKEQIGFADISAHPQAWNELLSQIPYPPQQPTINNATTQTGQSKILDPAKFYERGESRRPLSTCTEWTVEQAIPALRAAGFLQDEL
jgi:hypothetical protein